MSKSIIKSCNCQSDFQDELYGKRNRVHSVSEDGKKAHCSVCEGSAKVAKRNNAMTVRPGELITANRKYKSL